MPLSAEFPQRLFVAIPLPEVTRDDIGQHLPPVRHANWVAPRNLHLTPRVSG